MFKLFDRDFFKLFMGFMLILMASFALFFFSAELGKQSETETATTLNTR